MSNYRLPLLTLTSLALTTGAALAAPISLTALNAVGYTQNFDTLSNTANSTANDLTLAGWSLIEGGSGPRDNEQYAVDNGASNTGDTYSYGTAGSSDRALGSLRSGTLNSTFGAGFTNNTGSTITSLLISYFGEQWRLGTAGRTDRLDFAYSLNATDVTNGTWIDADLLDFLTPATAGVGAKDGNAAANRSSISSTLTNLSILEGATFWIRWTDFDATGADDGLAIDDFSIQANGAVANTVPEPAGLALLAMAAAGAAFSRRRTR
jgi:hypothetical protein